MNLNNTDKHMESQTPALRERPCVPGTKAVRGDQPCPAGYILWGVSSGRCLRVLRYVGTAL